MLTLASPAKINLFLRILNKKTDGYHELASLFQAINLVDYITFKKSEVDTLICNDPTIPCGESNLIFKAIRVYRQAVNCSIKWHIQLRKKIPIEAGLGGGSSNAATTLYALNQLSERPLPLEQLSKIAVQVGADVPFFLSEGTSYCTGIGEKIQSILPLKQQNFWIVKPKWGLSTPEVYQTIDVASLPKRDPEEVLKGFLNGMGEYFNDLELPAFALSEKTKELQQRLKECGFHTVVMSGSGSSFFCLGSTRPPDDPELSCFSVRFLNRPKSRWYEV